MINQWTITIIVVTLVLQAFSIVRANERIKELENDLGRITGVIAGYFDSINRPDVAAYFTGISKRRRDANSKAN